MNFAGFLRVRCQSRGINTAQQSYEFYGGSKRLGISGRQFQNVFRGVSTPSISLLLAVYDREPAEFHKELLLAFFRTHTSKEKNGTSFLKYLSSALSVATAEGNFDWEKIKHETYSDAQLDLLIGNPLAFKLHAYLLLFEELDLRKHRVEKELISALERVGLVKLERKMLRATAIRLRIPRYKQSNSNLVSKAHRFMFEFTNTFLAKEGTETQELAFAIQFVSPDIAAVAREQLKRLKEWLHTHVSVDTPKSGKPLKAILFLGAFKELESHEFF